MTQNLTDMGEPLSSLMSSVSEVSAKPGEVVGRLRLTLPRAGFDFVIKPFLPTFRERHPRIELELVFEDRRVDIVKEGFDAGIRLSEFVERDMVSLRLTPPALHRRGRTKLPGQVWNSRTPRGSSPA